MIPFIILINLTLILNFISPISSKYLNSNIQTMTFRFQKSFIYLDKITFQPTSAQIYFNTYLKSQRKIINHQYRIELLAIPDYLWEQYKQNKCQTKQQLSYLYQNNLSNILFKQNISQITVNLTSNMDQTTLKTLIIPISRQVTYYFVLSDCKKSLINQYFNRKSSIGIQLRITNNNKNHGSNQQQYTWLIPIMIFSCLTLLYMIKKTKKQQISSDTDWLLIILVVIIWLHISSLTIYYLGHLIYIIGIGYFYSFFSFVFLITSTISQSITLLLIIFCAYGWMTVYQSVQEDDIYYPMASIGGFSCLVCALLSKISDGDADKTHIYDSFAYDLIFAIKTLGLCIFILGIIRSWIKYKKNQQYKRYLIKLGIFGILCFLLVPIYITCTKLLQKHTRSNIVFLGVQIIKTIQIIIIGYQNIYQKSIYNQFTLYNRSFMQFDNKYL